LIELLVVIAIIALLLTLITPSLDRARHMVRTAVCRSNLRQWQTAWLSFAAAGGNEPFARVPKYVFYIPLTRFVEDMPSVTYCPETGPDNPRDPGSASRPWRYSAGGDAGTYYGSYGINGFWYNPYYDSSIYLDAGEKYITGEYTFPDDWFGTIGRREEDPNSPVFADAAWVDGWPRDNAEVPESYDDPMGGNRHRSKGDTRSMERFFADRHDLHINISFLDGSVRAVHLSELWNLKWSRGFEPQGKMPLP
jgi:prepilin-type processing-associated H-X9-DG protein